MVFTGIQPDSLDNMSIGSSFLTGLETDGAHDALATLENFQRRIPLQDEPVLWGPLVFQAS